MDKVTEMVNSPTVNKGGPYKATTKNEYIKTFNSLSSLFKTNDFHTLFTNQYDFVIETLNKQYTTNHAYWYKVNTYCKYYEIPFRDPPLKTGANESTPRNMYMMRQKIEKISDIRAKTFLSLFTNNTGDSVRRDWATVIIREHASEQQLIDARAVYCIETGVFEFRTLNKSSRTLTFTIEDNIKHMIEHYIPTLDDKSYLYNYKTKGEYTDKNRTESFSQYISRITLTYLGEKMTMNDFRKALVNEDHAKAESSGGNIAAILAEQARKKDHTLETEIKYYIERKGDKSDASTQTDRNCNDKHIDIAYKMIELGKTLDEIRDFLEMFSS